LHSVVESRNPTQRALPKLGGLLDFHELWERDRARERVVLLCHMYYTVSSV
jgi:hypothetical protein